MFKRSLIGVAIVSLLAVSAHAGHIRVKPPCWWPPTYDWMEVCEIPVMMDVGMYIEILCQQELVIKLKQVAFATYEGCTDIHIKSNFYAELGCTIETTGKVPGVYTCAIDDPMVPPTFCEAVAVRKVCVKAEDVSIVHVVPGCDVHVADVTITVKPGC
ncbi:MAG: hypothetical protein JSU70_19255 [Phycisphaerales bacterium]|nr:MAG: hypothetical protein JSU70_19255 [Phycisphaerales bacterium]